MKEWIDGRMDRWKNGQMEEWIDGIMDRWENGQVGEWKTGGVKLRDIPYDTI